MPMLGGEAAANVAFEYRAGEVQDLGWVADWLFGDASLPPGQLPAREPGPPPRRWLPPAGTPAFVRRPPVPAEHRPRRARQLALR
jgi:hypothetical protein